MSEVLIIQVAEDEDVVCPVCGITILDAEALHQQPSCPHVQFIYANGEAFEYCDPELEAVLAEEEAKADDEDEVFDMWEALKRHCGPGGVILEQRNQKMACGPVSFTLWAGIRSPMSRVSS